MQFELSEEQKAKLKEWMDKKPKEYTGAIGGRYTYSFHPTSLGVVVKVTDELKKDEIDLTDYEDW
jgi:hypothetical protein